MRRNKGIKKKICSIEEFEEIKVEENSFRDVVNDYSQKFGILKRCFNKRNF